MGAFECRVCGTDTLEELADFGRLPRVTSDCKPFPAGGRIVVCAGCGAVQKPGDDQWHAEIDAIYRDYEIYFQSGGVEQAVFDPARGVPHRRSAALLDRVGQIRQLPDEGSILDVGCGRGAFLSAFASFRPGWTLFGHELAPRDTERLYAIPRFEHLYSGPLDRLDARFDVITLMHSLEHFTDPLGGLADIRARLEPDGMLLIQVPNAAASPFDLVVADHASHFSRAHLAALMKRAGLGSVFVADDWITKELSGLAARDSAPEPVARSAAQVCDSMARVRSHLTWLHAVLDSARQAAGAHRGKFGIFGTSIASMWLFGELGDEVAFFVDEDPSRLGSLHGRPVLSPERIPDGGVVYFALIPQVAAAIAARLQRPSIELRTPPAL